MRDNITFYNQKEVSQALNCKRSKAYNVIKDLNEKRREAGKLVIDGKITALELFNKIDESQESQEPGRKISPLIIVERSTDVIQLYNGFYPELIALRLDQSQQSKIERLIRRLEDTSFKVYSKSMLGRLTTHPGKDTDKDLMAFASAVVELHTLFYSVSKLEYSDKRLRDGLGRVLEILEELLAGIVDFNTVR